jgi:hypothetical protein
MISLTDHIPLEGFSKLQKVLRIAHIVRKQFEEEYPEEIRFEGFCGLASLRIVIMCNHNKLYPRLVYGNYSGNFHTWIEYGQKIIDITATQFGKERIVITDINNRCYESYSKASKIKEIKDIIYWCWDEVDRSFFLRGQIIV